MAKIGVLHVLQQTRYFAVVTLIDCVKYGPVKYRAFHVMEHVTFRAFHVAERVKCRALRAVERRRSLVRGVC